MKLLFRVVRRVIGSLLVVFAITIGSWLLVAVLPGDPARLIVGPQASAEDVANARKVYGLDRPLASQLVTYLGHLIHTGPRPDPTSPEHKGCAEIFPHVHVDLGESYLYRQPVTRLIERKLPVSAWLALAAFIVQIVVGGGAGIAAATKPHSRADELTIGMSLLLSTVPTFVVALGLQYIAAYRLGIVPFDGFGKTTSEHVVALILPALALGLYGASMFARLVREEVRDALSRDHVRTALAKGASPLRILFRHALRIAFAPIATLAALDLGALLGGAVVVEKIFRLPGLGEMTVNAIQNRDAPTVVGAVLVSSAAMVLATLLADLLTLALDPRARKG